MATLSKNLIINKFTLPKELIDIIKDYTFHKIKKIQKNDNRYLMLLNMPYKEYDPTDGVTFVYLNINEEKDYFLTYHNFKIQLQTFVYEDVMIYGIEAHTFLIE